MELLIAIIKSLVVTFAVVAPVAFVLNGISNAANRMIEDRRNFKEWNRELDLYTEALESGDSEAAKIHSDNMDRLNNI